jgi:DNA (cytosine-5)-methyltransferase 1
LWGEYARLIGELRPRFVIVENVPGLLSLGMGRVLGDLSALGYDATWDCVPACAVGAPHRRDRVWVVAHSQSGGVRRRRSGPETQPAFLRQEIIAPDSIGDELRQQPRRSRRTGRQGEAVARDDGQARALADADKFARHEGRTGHAAEKPGRRNADRGRECEDLVANARREPTQVSASRRQPAIEVPTGTDRWEFEPDVGRVAHGVPARVDRLRALGNSVVPQIPEMIGRAILESVQ